ncbi:MAG: glutathione S-transferase N-terminal domain-containing protein [Candidatus Cloacimonetes bacterium]|nr:glutathione S-transferase N-terminal domain-containing protein [Candidatus Cloacimonadota bacterium]
MQLYGTKSSPFVRKVRVILYELGLDSQVTFIHAHPFVSTELLEINPLGKIPALKIGDGAILINSPLICEYLISLIPESTLLPKESKDRFGVLTLQAMADGLLDIAVALTMEKRRPPHLILEDNIQRHKQNILNTIHWLEGLPDNSCLCPAPDEEINLGSLSLACALLYLDFRHNDLHWRESAPGLHKWLTHISNRQSLKETVYCD